MQVLRSDRETEPNLYFVNLIRSTDAVEWLSLHLAFFLKHGLTLRVSLEDIQSELLVCLRSILTFAELTSRVCYLALLSTSLEIYRRLVSVRIRLDMQFL